MLGQRQLVLDCAGIGVAVAVLVSVWDRPVNALPASVAVCLCLPDLLSDQPHPCTGTPCPLAPHALPPSCPCDVGYWWCGVVLSGWTIEA